MLEKAVQRSKLKNFLTSEIAMFEGFDTKASDTSADWREFERSLFSFRTSWPVTLSEFRSSFKRLRSVSYDQQVTTRTSLGIH